MKIVSKQEFNSLASSLKSSLAALNAPVKTSRLQDIFAQSLGYKSANGLLNSGLPKDFVLTEEQGVRLSTLLAQNHNITNVDGYSLLRELESKHQSYSTVRGSDHKCYPSEISENENYWYLTENGWLPWCEMDFSKMRVELNIYRVVHASSHAFGGSARPIWTADIGSYEFEIEARRLERKFGDWPDKGSMYPVVG